jgi:hypothetical protein
VKVLELSAKDVVANTILEYYDATTTDNFNGNVNVKVSVFVNIADSRLCQWYADVLVIYASTAA